MLRPLMVASCLFLFAGLTAAQSNPNTPVPSDAEIARILADRVDAYHQGVGIVVGVIEPQGRRFVSYGSLQKRDARRPDAGTVFEIGSVTKVFTSLLLSDMVQRGEVSLNDPVSKYLPEGVKVPERNGRAITLVDLSTHTSGLPRLPGNLRPKDPANPYADYSSDMLFEFLSAYHLPRNIGAQFEYSNLGGGLLGLALARRAGTDYESLVRARIAGPLGMKSTGITLPPDIKGRLATGHNDKLEPAPNWDLPTLAGAGALRSTASDLVTFLAANLGYLETPLSPAMTAMLAVRRPTGAPNLGDVALGWLITKPSDHEIVWHNGGTGGYRSFVGFEPRARVGVVVLSNTFTATGVDDIGMHLLDSHVPLIQAPKEHKEVTIDPKLYDIYAGRYQLAPGFILSVTRNGDKLFAQATGQQKLEIFPESDRQFFFKVVDAQITFDAAGKDLVLHQNGANMPAKRID